MVMLFQCNDMQTQNLSRREISICYGHKMNGINRLARENVQKQARGEGVGGREWQLEAKLLNLLGLLHFVEVSEWLARP